MSARLRMAKVLIQHNETLADATKIELTREGGWTHELGDHDALVHYLLLTCFDVLGQPDKHVTFEDWLTSEKERYRLEREAAIGGAPPGQNTFALAGHLAKAHGEIYGVRKSFVRFIKEKLSEADRRQLLDSVRLDPAPTDPATYDKERIAFLYQTRNAFTHRAEIRGQLWRVLMPLTVVLESGVLKYGESAIASDAKGRCCYVRRWPFALYEIIARYIGEPIPDFAIAVALTVVTSTGKGWWSVVTWKDLATPAALQQCAKEQEMREAAASHVT